MKTFLWYCIFVFSTFYNNNINAKLTSITTTTSSIVFVFISLLRFGCGLFYYEQRKSNILVSFATITKERKMWNKRKKKLKLMWLKYALFLAGSGTHMHYLSLSKKIYVLVSLFWYSFLLFCYFFWLTEHTCVYIYNIVNLSSCNGFHMYGLVLIKNEELFIYILSCFT